MAAATAALPLGGAILLRNGVALPRVGLGTYQVRGAECAAAVAAALRAGYRHIDTAAVYRNEGDVADGIAASGLPREQLFITSKLQPKDAGDGAYDACLRSLAALRTGYLDLYLVHWPGAQGMRLDDPALPEVRRRSWRCLERLHAEGRVRAIGVSNFTPAHLAEFDGGWASVRPMVNQFELHPLCPAREIVAACRARGIEVVAYSSLARGAPQLLEAPAVAAAAAAHGVTPPQVALRWAVQRGFAVIPKSVRPDRVVENGPAAVGDGAPWSLTDEELAATDALGDPGAAPGAARGGAVLRTCWDPYTVS